MAIRFTPRQPRKKRESPRWWDNILPKIHKRKQAAKWGFVIGLIAAVISKGIFYFPAVGNSACDLVSFLILSVEAMVAGLYLVSFVLPKRYGEHLTMGSVFEAGLITVLATSLVFSLALPYFLKLIGIQTPC